MSYEPSKFRYSALTFVFERQVYEHSCCVAAQIICCSRHCSNGASLGDLVIAESRLKLKFNFLNFSFSVKRGGGGLLETC